MENTKRQTDVFSFSRNFTESSDYKSKLTMVRNSGVESSVEIDLIVRWLWYFIKYYENDEEVDLSIGEWVHHWQWQHGTPRTG